MAIAYGAAGGNAVQAQIRYREQFPEGLYLVQKRPKRLWQRSFPARGLTKSTAKIRQDRGSMVRRAQACITH
jgi:hypothetical protein